MLFELEKLTAIDEAPFYSDNYRDEYFGTYDKKHCIIVYYKNEAVPEIIFE